MNKLEELEMYQEINKRIQTPKEEYLKGIDVLKRLDLLEDEVIKYLNAIGKRDKMDVYEKASKRIE